MMLLAALFAAQLQITVCQTCELKTIAAALQAAPAGAVITVKAGVYEEPDLTIDKEIHLIGEPGAVIDGGRKADGIRVVKADGVEISGFKIRHSGKSYIHEFAGIKVEDSERCTLRGNSLDENNYAIYLANTHHCTIADNRITGVVGNEADTGNGIHIWQGHGHHISGNRISGQRDGIYFEFVTDSTIEDNVSCGNLRYGLHFMFSHEDKYLHNNFCRNGSGVAVMYSHEIEMTDNTFDHNEGMASYGLLLKEIKEARITDNTFRANSIGIYMEGSNRSKFAHNVFTQSGWGLRILGDCDANSFIGNSFSANTFDVATNSSNNPNTFTGNYWSQYDGYDLDHDGKGDTPFRLVSLSSVILERVDASFPLLRSPLFSLLDEIERALPSLIPQRMEDAAPLMRSPQGVSAND